MKTSFYIVCMVLARLRRIVHEDIPGAVILMYHSFDTVGWKYGVHPDELEWQLAHLVKHYSVVPLGDVVRFVCGERKLPRRAVAITVDDVYEDTYTVLYPLLQKYGVHATLFLTTDLSPQGKLGDLQRPTWGQLREMHESGLVNIEVHGHTHKNWTTLPVGSAELSNEVLGSRSEIERHIGLQPRYAAYPAGRRSSELEQYLAEQGFSAAAAITEGPVVAGDDPYALRRIQVDRSMTRTIFKLRLSSEALRAARTLRALTCAH